MSLDEILQPPFGDVDDRIRAIANALGLQTIIWKYDSNDWKAGTGNITTETVDANYQALINNMTSGTFSTVRRNYWFLYSGTEKSVLARYHNADP